jgi:hypothetical protein
VGGRGDQAAQRDLLAVERRGVAELRVERVETRCSPPEQGRLVPAAAMPGLRAAGRGEDLVARARVDVLEIEGGPAAASAIIAANAS